MRRFCLFLSFFALHCCPLLAQPFTVPTLYTGCVVHTGTGTVYEEGALGIINGEIDYVGRQVAAPKGRYEREVPCSGKHIYPALIATNTTLGITEIDAVRATRDFRETGQINPNVRAISAYNAESDVVATVLANGVLFAQVAPQGGVLSGTSAAVVLSAWNWEDATYSSDEGLHLHWPRIYKSKSNDDHDPVAILLNEDYEKELRSIRSFFAEARAYAQRPEPLQRDLRLEAMRGLWDGSKRLYVHADFIKELREITLFKSDFGIDKLTIVGGNDSWMVANLLIESNISVLVSRVNSLPRFAEDGIEGPYSLPGKLASSGVLFAFQMAGSKETMHNRNLAFNAGTAIGYGLSREDALKALTINPARLLGISHRTGSLEVGKEANFLITTGDLFDMRTGTVESAYLRGRELNLDNRQDELYRKYARKLGVLAD